MTTESAQPTRYAVYCNGHDDMNEKSEEIITKCNNGKRIYLTEQGYNQQISNPWKTWRCPRCGQDAWWDDDNYEDPIYRLAEEN